MSLPKPKLGNEYLARDLTVRVMRQCMIEPVGHGPRLTDEEIAAILENLASAIRKELKK